MEEELSRDFCFELPAKTPAKLPVNPNYVLSKALEMMRDEPFFWLPPEDVKKRERGRGDWICWGSHETVISAFTSKWALIITRKAKGRYHVHAVKAQGVHLSWHYPFYPQAAGNVAEAA
jgi:hypothetical protein